MSSEASTHVITLADSNPDKTLAHPLNRPSYDPNDTYIGYDQPTNVSPSRTQLSFGAPVSISNYIGNVGDDVHWVERITGSLKTLKVPLEVREMRTGTASNTDAAGTIMISGNTAATYTFLGRYSLPPSCTLTPLADTTQFGAWWVEINATTLTANVKTLGTISFSYHCWGLT